MLYKLIFGNSYSLRRALLVLLLLLLPTAIFLNNALIWDDPVIVAAHAHWSLRALFAPYAINTASFWRPLAVLAISLPSLLGLPIWANKLCSLVLYLIQCGLALAILDLGLRARQRATDSAALVVLAAILALHPVFVETTLWIAARADLLVGVLVLLAVYWMLSVHEQSVQRANTRSRLGGLLCGLLLAILLCTAKDTGIIWAVLAVMVLFYLTSAAQYAWRWYWGASGFGMLTGILLYLMARYLVLGQLFGMTDVALHNTASPVERSQMALEFIVRSLVNIFLPILDPSPFKSAGWFGGWSTGSLGLVAGVIVAALGLAIFKLIKKNHLSAMLIVCALIAIGLHAFVQAFLAETAYGSVIADRYIAPSAVLLYIALAWLSEPAAPSANDSSIANYSLVALSALLLLQSLLLWSTARLSWSSELGLWESAWASGAQSRIVAENYATAYFNLDQYKLARDIARFWIGSNRASVDELELCSLDDIVLTADLAMRDHSDTMRSASNALPIGWCKATLAQHVATVLINDACPKVLTMLNRQRDQDSSAGVSDTLRSTAHTQQQLDLLAAYGEARCGDYSKALTLLDAVGRTDKNWAVDGEQARKLLESARRLAH